jgi:hypothetical protein
LKGFNELSGQIRARRPPSQKINGIESHHLAGWRGIARRRTALLRYVHGFVSGNRLDPEFLQEAAHGGSGYARSGFWQRRLGYSAAHRLAAGGLAAFAPRGR